jgi:hypothetical protein
MLGRNYTRGLDIGQPNPAEVFFSFMELALNT